MSDDLNLKVEQLLTQTEQLTEENEKLRDIQYELEQNLLAAEDQNHYFKLMSQYKDKVHKLEQELQKTKDQLIGVTEQLAIAEAVLSVQVTDSALAYFKDKQGEIEMKNNLEGVWRKEFQEYFKAIPWGPFYSPYNMNKSDISTMEEGYVVGRRKAQDEINRLEQELQKTREQLKKAIHHLDELYENDRSEGVADFIENYYFEKDKQGEG